MDSLSGPKDKVAVVQALAQRYHTTVVMTGKVDLISDGNAVYAVHNNHALLGTLTGHQNKPIENIIIPLW